MAEPDGAGRHGRRPGRRGGGGHGARRAAVDADLPRRLLGPGCDGEHDRLGLPGRAPRFSRAGCRPRAALRLGRRRVHRRRGIAVRAVAGDAIGPAGAGHGWNAPRGRAGSARAAPTQGCRSRRASALAHGRGHRAGRASLPGRSVLLRGRRRRDPQPQRRSRRLPGLSAQAAGDREHDRPLQHPAGHGHRWPLAAAGADPDRCPVTAADGGPRPGGVVDRRGHAGPGCGR